ncbi:hypothetical protein [Streptomyces sp. NPDC002088]|uniref:hypothetical protein n=1 Tax=Streptomyces sp. NPDC002088 TaxID=3154665 RepID=UPI00331651F6
MSADEVTHGIDADASLVRTGPRHAAPKKPLFTRFHVPAGKAIALAAMPTAVLMGMGLTPTLALADDQPTSTSQAAEEYKDCVAALADSTDASASASPSPSASASASESADSKTDDSTDSGSKSSDSSDTSGTSSSSDSGSDDKAEPTPSQSSSASDSSASGSSDTSTASPSASETSDNLLDTIGDTLKDVFTGGSGSTESASATPSPSASSSASEDSSSSDESVSDTVKDTTEKLTDTVNDTVKDTTDTVSKAAEDTTEAVEKAAEDATASPSPSASSTTDPDDCAAATDAEGGVDNKMPLPDNPWYLNASSLTLKGASYKGIVKVKTANGTVKEVLKYVISDGTDIGDLHQTVKDEQSGKTYHVQAGKGTTSTITDGDTIMYTESISGNLFGLIPITFSPENPPPLDLPLIYFTNVKVQQAGQFGGTLTVPGMHQYITD